MQQGQLAEWVRQVKMYVDHSLLGFLGKHKLEVSFALPSKCSTIPPFAITQAAPGANLTAFREVMHYDNLVSVVLFSFLLALLTFRVVP